MESQKSKLKFEYSDEFGNVTKTEEEFDMSVIDDAGIDNFEHIVDRFKAFLRFSGYAEKLVETITIEKE